MIIKVPDSLTAGQSLSLECIVTTVRGIMSRIDVVWTSDEVEIKKTIGANISSSTNSSILYRDFYNISLLTTAEEDKVYRCIGIVNAIPNLNSETSITIDVFGT